MIKALDSQSQLFLASLARIEARQQKVQRALSSGIRVGTPSDEPDRVVHILQLRSEIARATTIGETLDRLASEVNAAEAAMGVAVELVERARVLAAQGASSTATDRAALALETKQLHEQLVNLTFTASEGRLVFSGDQDQQRLYAIDWTQPAGVTRLATAENTREIQDVNGSRFIGSRTAHELFDARDALGDPAENNVFNAVYTLSIALQNDDRDAVEAAAGQIGRALDHLGIQTSFYGHAQNRVRDAIELNKSSLVGRKTELGLAQDTDLAEAVVELKLAEVHMESALAAQSKMPRTSLFDYLA
jgi:flagellar hook-associated protein 3 FlgL